MSLPLDLLPPILEFLDVWDLEQCCLVAVAFHQIARPLCFSHVILCSTTWKSKCTFLLRERGEDLRSHIKKVTMRIEGIPGLSQNDEFEPLIQSLLKTVGPQLNAFCIQTNTDYYWRELLPSFRELIHTGTMSRVRSLELLGITQIRLLTALSRMSHIKSLRLGSTDYVIGKPEEDITKENLEILSLPCLTSLAMDTFGEEDFGQTTSLARYLAVHGEYIQYLRFGRFCDEDFPLTLSFLSPFVGLRNSVVHLSFGTHLYETAVRQHPTEFKGLDFGLFARLQTLTFTTPVNSSPSDWRYWWTYISKSLNYPTAVERLRSLKTMKVVLLSRNPPDENPSSAINELVTKFDFEIHIMGSGDRIRQNFLEIARTFRVCLPLWEEAGKLKFWVTD
ncbi:hypothetical protein DL96DRAFT_1581142 [Flagelloscypha sp. PMI_526]|nr:hypothetical protein DL96DRAFT_1581142 [Flagelloscypha sp. PMI_526]